MSNLRDTPTCHKIAQIRLLISSGEIDATGAGIPRFLEPATQVLRQNPTSYTLSEDGAFTSSSHNMTVTGTWTLEGDTLTITSPEHD